MESLEKNYTTPGHPTAFAGKRLLYDYYPNISQDKIDAFLQTQNSYTLKRDIKPVQGYNPYYVWDKRKLLQIDLIDFSMDRELVSANDGFRYIFCVIDSLTRFLWVELMKSKSSVETLRTYRKIKGRIGPIPQRILGDRGKEWNNRAFKNELRKDGTRLIFPNNKAGTVERVQRTLQSLIYKYIEHTQNMRFVDVLQRLVKTYNTKRHSTIKMTPTDAENSENLALLRKNVSEYYTKATRGGTNKTIFKIGDDVRIMANRGRFGRSYDHTFTEEVFKVGDINTKMPKPQYTITDWYGGEKVQGTFYGSELQKVRGDVFKADVLKERKKKGVKEVFVHWAGTNSSRDEWIPEKDLYHTF